jgi:hypothetical protein
MAAATMTDFRRFQKNQLTGQFPTAISLFLAQKDELTLIKPALDQQQSSASPHKRPYRLYSGT